MPSKRIITAFVLVLFGAAISFPFLDTQTDIFKKESSTGKTITTVTVEPLSNVVPESVLPGDMQTVRTGEIVEVVWHPKMSVKRVQFVPVEQRDPQCQLDALGQNPWPSEVCNEGHSVSYTERPGHQSETFRIRSESPLCENKGRWQSYVRLSLALVEGEMSLWGGPIIIDCS